MVGTTGWFGPVRALTLVLVVVVGAATVVGAAETTTTVPPPEVTVAPPPTAPPETVGGPTERDPSWLASVALVCGSSAGTRIVESFEAFVDPGQSANLYVATPQSGGQALTPVAVGNEVAADARLRWNIQDVFLGPWPVDSVVDTCVDAGQASGDRLPETGAGGSLTLVLVGVGLVAGGLVVLGAGRRRAVPSADD